MKKFIPDSRNFGGRKVISDHFKFHFETLSRVRPTLQTRIKVDHSQSISMHRTSQSFHQTRHNRLLLSEHLLNIKHMNRRIQSLGSYNERKKNQFDPITHPVVFFRNKMNTFNLVLDQKFINKSVKPPKMNKVYMERSRRRPKTSMELRVEIPVVDGNEKNPVDRLKDELVQTIVQNRIYREQDLQDLFKFTREANSHLDQSALDRAISLAYQNLSL